MSNFFKSRKLRASKTSTTKMSSKLSMLLSTSQITTCEYNVDYCGHHVGENFSHVS